MLQPTDSPSTPLDSHDTTVLLQTDGADGRALARHLRADGFIVLEARTTAELVGWLRALDGRETRAPDVVITDDVAALSALEAEDEPPPVIVITPRDDWTSFVDAERAGAAFVFEASADDGALRCAVFALTRSW